MHVSIVGSGYVGTTVAACLADLGHDVVNVEIDPDVVDAINAGDAPIHEPGLQERLEAHAGDRLRATTDYDEILETDLTFLCLPTPSTDDGSLELGPMRSGSRSLGRTLADKPDDHLVVVKSTVLPGTTEDVVGPIVAEESGTPVGDGLELAMNPEFLRMGTAVSDFLEPDKLVIGATSEDAAATVRELYAPILEGKVPAVSSVVDADDSSDAVVDDSNVADTDDPAAVETPDLVETDLREAELIKYANNAFLAAKVSLVNDLGNVAKEYGADAYEVLEAVGLDDRISEQFMRSGLGWGGSCFPKDVDAIRAGAREQGYEPDLLDAAVSVNDTQPRRLVDLLADHVDLEGATIAVLGLSFKPGTDDIRKSRALDVIEHLLAAGATVVAYDPVAVENVRETYPDLEISYAESAAEALSGADGAVVATDWPEFDDLAFEGMANRVLVDGRRIDVDEDVLEVYEGLTW